MLCIDCALHFKPNILSTINIGPQRLTTDSGRPTTNLVSCTQYIKDCTQVMMAANEQYFVKILLAHSDGLL